MNNREFMPLSDKNGTARDAGSADVLVEKLCGEESKRLIRQHGGILEGNYCNKNLKRSYFNGTKFLNCDFTNVSATGVLWKNSTFFGGKYNCADFEYADLSGSKWERSNVDQEQAQIYGAGFNGVNLRNSFLDQVDIQGSSFAHADLTGSTFINCNMNGTFEGCLFTDSKLEDISFVNSNIDYADFSRATFRNVTISLLDFPYLFGVNREVLSDHHALTLESSNKGKKKAFHYQELKEIKEELINFFAGRDEFFAAANLALFFELPDRFLSFFISGARIAWEQENYRGLKFLCKLIRQAEDATGEFGKAKLHQMYDMIAARVGASENPAVLNQYELHDGQIRRYLLENPKNMFSICYVAKTCDGQKAQELIAEISKRIIEICDITGIELEIVSSSISLHSPARNKIDIKIINVVNNDQAEIRQCNPWNTPTICALLISATSLLFTALPVVSNWLAQEETSPPPQAFEYAKTYRPKIEHAVIQDSYEVKDGLRILARTENGTVVLLLDSKDNKRLTNI